MFWMPIIMAASALAKNQQDAEKEKRDRYVESEKARMSPWTGIKPGEVHYAQPATNLMQAGGSYLAYDQGQKQNELLNKLLEKRMAKEMTSPMDNRGGGGDSSPMLNVQQGNPLNIGMNDEESQPTPVLGSGFWSQLMGKGGGGGGNLAQSLYSGIGSLYS